MRFEVEVDDGANLAALHKARGAFNVQNPNAQAGDMPAYVQALMDQAVKTALAPLGPVTLPQALDQIATLEAQNSALVKQVSAAPAASAPAPAA